ncbi:hypothetical protein OGAPHI_004270 [Ogataea philodendri]|uniref:Uncharacterized protein n=1 Tax=Ogataea philodendri TaxID=1378263 RepID=A0A9P8T5M2_9ASCO|nr:uncharacterized protein OGAPHI_004270 [Ogataea philodendri]KAH3666081.1 hypothetical protein OGAPHI_004270 [Ogataea philodendri]
MSKKGRINCFLIRSQMILVISSPSISTTGVFTLILVIAMCFQSSLVAHRSDIGKKIAPVTLVAGSGSVEQKLRLAEEHSAEGTKGNAEADLSRPALQQLQQQLAAPLLFCCLDQLLGILEPRRDSREIRLREHEKVAGAAVDPSGSFLRNECDDLGLVSNLPTRGLAVRELAGCDIVAIETPEEEEADGIAGPVIGEPVGSRIGVVRVADRNTVGPVVDVVQQQLEQPAQQWFRSQVFGPQSLSPASKVF